MKLSRGNDTVRAYSLINTIFFIHYLCQEGYVIGWVSLFVRLPLNFLYHLSKSISVVMRREEWCNLGRSRRDRQTFTALPNLDTQISLTGPWEGESMQAQGEHVNSTLKLPRRFKPGMLLLVTALGGGGGGGQLVSGRAICLVIMNNMLTSYSRWWRPGLNS